MSSAAAAANRAFGIDRGMPFPLSRHRRGRRRRAGRQQPGRHDAAGHAVLRRGPRARAPSTSSSTRGARRPPQTPRLHLQPLPGTDLALANGLLHIALARGPGRRATTSPPRTTGFDAVRAGVGRLLARPGRADHRRPGGRPARAPVRRWPAPRRRSSSPPAAPSSTAAAPTPRRRASTSRSPSACPAGRSAATARSPARATGRAAASTGRRPTSCPATASSTDPAARAHVAAVWGIDPDDLPRPGRSAFELLDRARHRRRRPHAAGAGVATSRSRAPDASRVDEPAGARSTSWSSPTSSCPRPPSSPTSSCPRASGPRRTAR